MGAGSGRIAAARVVSRCGFSRTVRNMLRESRGVREGEGRREGGGTAGERARRGGGVGKGHDTSPTLGLDQDINDGKMQTKLYKNSSFS